MMTPPAIELEQVTVAYHRTIALYGVTLQLSAGTICGVVGMNGAGKSTLFKAIMGFVQPNRGWIRIHGLPLREVQRRSLVAYVPQSETVDWQFPLRVWDVVMMGRYGKMNWLRQPRALDYQRVQQSLEQVELWPLRHRQIGELSGGQKKRMFLARAFAQEAQVLLLDEPFAGVDIKTEKLIIDLLLAQRQAGHTILVSSHDLASISTFCDQVILINRSILAYGTTADVFTPENLARAFGGSLRDPPAV